MGSVAAVEPVLQVHTCLANDIIRPYQIMVHHLDNQLCRHREGQCEFKHPEGYKECQTHQQSDRDRQRLLGRSTDRY